MARHLKQWKYLDLPPKNSRQDTVGPYGKVWEPLHYNNVPTITTMIKNVIQAIPMMIINLFKSALQTHHN